MRHSRDGRFVFVGDSGNVIDTGTRQVITTLAQLRNTRKFLENDWLSGSPVSTTTRYGLGYVTQRGECTEISATSKQFPRLVVVSEYKKNGMATASHWRSRSPN